MADLIGLMAQTTVAQMLSRNDFALRYESGVPIALHEFLYPIAQAYDSVAMRAGVELGGSDQLFNLLVGRAYQEQAGQVKQICMTTPLLEGTDGVARMAKSRGNYIGLTEPPSEQFGKLMSLPDSMIPRFALLAAFRSQASVDALVANLAAGSIHPMTAKKDLAEEIVARYHGHAEARAARDRFEATVQRGELPAEIPDVKVDGARSLADVLVAVGFAQSKREAQRAIESGSVRLDGVQVRDARQAWNASTPVTLALGARRFVRVVPNQ
jgi:tyrosyl-tRNA synthetase